MTIEEWKLRVSSVKVNDDIRARTGMRMLYIYPDSSMIAWGSRIANDGQEVFYYALPNTGHQWLAEESGGMFGYTNVEQFLWDTYVNPPDEEEEEDAESESDDV